MSKIIGIDLGTTNSCVSVMEGNEPVVIPNAENRIAPYCALLKVEKESRRRCKTSAITNPEKTIYSIKRFMGESFSKCKEIKMFLTK